MEEIFKKIKEKNKRNVIHHITDKKFLKYGNILEEYNWEEWDEIMRGVNIPQDGNKYIASDVFLEKAEVKEKMEAALYGGVEIQVGYCNGKNSNLNGLEYHKSSEINIAVTDLVLILGHTENIYKNHYDTENLDIFYLPRGTMIEIYQTTLHFAPCTVNEEGFKCIVVLPKGTNEYINFKRHMVTQEDELLFMKNKWLIAHPDREPLISKGAYPGIIGDNLKIEYI